VVSLLLSLQYLSERPPSRQLDSTVFLSIIGYSASLVSRMTDSSRSHSIVPNLDHVVLRTSPSASHSNTLNLKTFDIAEIAEVGYTPHLVPQPTSALPTTVPLREVENNLEDFTTNTDPQIPRVCIGHKAESLGEASLPCPPAPVAPHLILAG
jgi:hypothetical protein